MKFEALQIITVMLLKSLMIKTSAKAKIVTALLSPSLQKRRFKKVHSAFLSIHLKSVIGRERKLPSEFITPINHPASAPHTYNY
jgi:hypothetical protein